MMKLEIKELSELNYISTKLFTIRTFEGFVDIISRINNEVLLSTDNIEDLRPYGFEVTHLKQTSLSEIEGICEEEQVNITYCFKTRRWYGRDNRGNLVGIDGMLRKYNYYL